MAEKRRKRKTVIIQESSSSDEETTPVKDDGETILNPLSSPKDTPRSSERLQKRRCREFQKPTREDVWKKITPTKSPGKYEQLRPKRLVNNYTKENNRYNYDPNETSGDESMEDFLDDSISEQSSSDDTREKAKQKKQIRIKGRHRRLLTRSGSDDSSSTDDGSAQETNDQNTAGESALILSGDSAICVETRNNRTDKLNAESDNDSVKENGTDKETEDITVAKAKRHNRSIIESDDDITTSSDTDDKEDVVVKRKHNRSIIESDDDDTNVDKNDGNLKSENVCGGYAKSTEEENLDINGKRSDCKLNEDKNATDDESSKDSEKKRKNGLSPNTSTHSLETNKSAKDSEVRENLVKKTSRTSVTESDSSETSEDSDNEINDNEDTVGHSGRVRVQMLKRKNERKALFEKFRMERQRRLSKEH